ncbi:hypothetical protein [Rufibacter soli]
MSEECRKGGGAEMKKVLVSELQVGDCFKISARHRKVVHVTKVFDLDQSHYKNSNPQIFKDHYENRVMVMDGCRQLKGFKNEEVILISTERKEAAQK